nr:nucleotide-binding alpha-beta plait domain-containing protein [Tanacetum cinerariifolium]
MFGISISGFCLFVRGWQLAMVNMRSLRSKEDDVQKISSSVFVTNFAEQFSAKDLWNTCKIGKLKFHANVARYQRDPGKNNYQRLNKGTNVSNGGGIKNGGGLNSSAN